MTEIQSFRYTNVDFTLSDQYFVKEDPEDPESPEVSYEGPVSQMMVENISVRASGERIKYLPSGAGSWKELYTGRHQLSFSGTMKITGDDVEVIDFLEAAATGREVKVTIGADTYTKCRVTEADIQTEGQKDGTYVYKGSVVMTFIPSGRNLPGYGSGNWIWLLQTSSGSYDQNEMVLKKPDGTIVPAILKYSEWVWVAARYQVIGTLTTNDMGNIMPVEGDTEKSGSDLYARFLGPGGNSVVRNLGSGTWSKEKVVVRHRPQAAMTIVQELWVSKQAPVAYDVVKVHETEELKDKDTGTCEATE